MAALVLKSGVGLALVAALAWAQAPDIQVFLTAGQVNEGAAQALRVLGASWQNSWTPLIIDLARMLPPLPGRSAGAESAGAAGLNDNPDGNGATTRPRPDRDLVDAGPTLNPGQLARRRLTQFLEKQTRQKFGDDLAAWRRWMWALPNNPHPEYPRFKAAVYSVIDKRMASFFQPGMKTSIRLDEVDWGGVTVNGIPPLVYPKNISAREATYLKDNNVVFGLFVNGEARAYPKRILAWHEMARDKIGGVELTIVYCTLCGTVIPYESVAAGKHRVMGTSGLLYRSNKLMFDEETNSLWSTFEGKPVAGPLTGSGIELPVRSSVTTTWKEWKTTHPDTTVVSLDTGFKRDYSEGKAYHDYFDNDTIMFEVPALDTRLKNKAEVLVMRLPEPVAVSADFLRKHPVYAMKSGTRSLVIVTSADGANRVFDPQPHQFAEQAGGPVITDSAGARWQVTEDGLVAGDRKLPRVAANRAFWFGWHAQFPDTALIK